MKTWSSSLRGLIETLDGLRAKGVKFRSLTEPIAADIPKNRILWDALALFTALERSLASQRIQAAIEQGRRSGPPEAGQTRLLKPWRVEMALHRIGEGLEDVREAALRTSVRPPCAGRLPKPPNRRARRILPQKGELIRCG
jgi:DNA invertase Pin-like site-specific DNA recombinase